MPYHLIHRRVEARVTPTTVDVFFNGRRVASHVRLAGRGRFATDRAHRPRFDLAALGCDTGNRL